jgi:hypothetical protein
MAEYQTHGFIVRQSGENEIEITQSHFDDHQQSGVIITLDEIDNLIKALEQMRRESSSASNPS